MAGGDFDGDLNMLSFNEVLLALADATARAVAACGWEAIEKAWRANTYKSKIACLVANASPGSTSDSPLAEIR